MTVKNAILNTLIWITVLTFPIQCALDFSPQNVASTCIVLFSSLTMLGYLKWSRAADDQPLSSIALLGFCVTSQFGALLTMTAFLRPIRSSLYDPINTFGTLAFYLMVALGVHVAYRYFSYPPVRKAGLLRSLFDRVGIYRIPPSPALWLMGFIGLCSFFLSSRLGIVARVSSAFNILGWAPFLIPLFLREVGPAYCNAQRNRLYLVGYTGLVVLMGIALNVRVIMFIGLVTVGLLYLLMGIRSRAPVESKSVLKLFLLGGAVALLAIPLSDFATAMAIARGARGHVSGLEMIQKTVDVWRRPALIAAYRAENAQVAQFKAYDELYVPNTLLARFVETKFHDNALHFAASLKTEQSIEALRNVTIANTWASLPTPILKFLHIPVDKEDLQFSMGDYLAYLSRGVPLEGRKTGSMFAQGIAVMGPLFPFVYAIMCLLLFGVMDLMTVRETSGKTTLSAIAMMSLWTWFYRGLTTDSISNLFVFLFRNSMQSLAVYVIVLFIALIFFGGKRRAVRTQGLPELQQAN